VEETSGERRRGLFWMKVLILGPPGSGKGTEAALLASTFHLKHVSVGELLRKEAKKNKDIRDVIERGDLLSDKESFAVVKKYLPEDDFILDGFPRTFSQIKLFDTFMKVDFVLYLDTDDDEVVRRLLLRGRKDDTEEVVRHRLWIYHQETKKILSFYKKKVLRVDGNAFIPEVFQELCEKMRERL